MAGSGPTKSWNPFAAASFKRQSSVAASDKCSSHRGSSQMGDRSSSVAGGELSADSRAGSAAVPPLAPAPTGADIFAAVAHLEPSSDAAGSRTVSIKGTVPPSLATISRQSMMSASQRNTRPPSLSRVSG